MVGHHRLEVRPARHLGHDAAEPRVLVDAARDGVDEQGLAAHDADAGLVARRLDAEHQRLVTHRRSPLRQRLRMHERVDAARLVVAAAQVLMRVEPAAFVEVARCGVVGAHLEHDECPQPRRRARASSSSSSSRPRPRALRARGDRNRHDVGDVAARWSSPAYPATPDAVVDARRSRGAGGRRARPTTSLRPTRRREEVALERRERRRGRSTGPRAAPRRADATHRPPS